MRLGGGTWTRDRFCIDEFSRSESEKYGSSHPCNLRVFRAWKQCLSSTCLCGVRYRVARELCLPLLPEIGRLSLAVRPLCSGIPLIPHWIACCMAVPPNWFNTGIPTRRLAVGNNAAAQGWGSLALLLDLCCSSGWQCPVGSRGLWWIQGRDCNICSGALCGPPLRST